MHGGPQNSEVQKYRSSQEEPIKTTEGEALGDECGSSSRMKLKKPLSGEKNRNSQNEPITEVWLCYMLQGNEDVWKSS